MQDDPRYRAGVVAQRLEELGHAISKLTQVIEGVEVRVGGIESELRGQRDVSAYKRWALPVISTLVVVGLTLIDRLVR